MTAKTQDGQKVFSHRKVWQEIGTDLRGNQQYKSWEIKNTVDLSLQPRATHTERLAIPFPAGTAAAEIEATVTYHHRPGEEFVVHRVAKPVTFPR